MDAIKKAEAQINFHEELDRGEIEFAEDIDGYHVDEIGDEEYERSTWYDKEYKPL